MTNLNLIKISDLPDDFLVSKSKLYKWTSARKNSELFIKIDGIIFLDMDKWNEFVESNRLKKGA